MHLAQRFIAKYYAADGGEFDRMRLFGEVRRIFAEWIDGGYLACVQVPEDVLVEYPNLTDEACNRVNDAIVRQATEKGDESVSAFLDDFLPTGSSSAVSFRISRTKKIAHETDAAKSHVNYAICDSTWEEALCRVLEAHPRTLAYVKNAGLDFEVPYVVGNERRQYRPDFIALVDDGRGGDDPLHLVIEVKGYRYLDANAKRSTMETYWIPSVNRLGTYGRWAFVELNEEHFARDEDARRANCAAAYAAAIEKLSGR